MNMTWLDWAMIAALMIFITIMALRAIRYNRGVADFLAANRCAGRYLLTTASGVASIGAVGIIQNFETTYKTGFPPGYWAAVSFPLTVFITLSGWVIYRYRQTRALTLAQFFEMRYSRRFRIFAGTICWISGILNFGVFPGIIANFFMQFCNLPQAITVSGYNIALFPVIMFILLFFSIIFTFWGGQVTVLVTDFWQGFFSFTVTFVIILFLWYLIPWSRIGEALIIASPPGKSLIDPFSVGAMPDFNFWYYIIGWILVLYGALGWQGMQAYQTCAITAHEAKMAAVVGGLRSAVLGLLITLVPVIAVAVMYHPAYSDIAAKVTSHLAASFPTNPQAQIQMTVPTVLSYLLPKGLVGAFAATMMAFAIALNGTYMHSWGSILVQDVVVPLRKKPPSQKQHLLWLRSSIVLTGVFAFVFSMVFELRDYIWMYFQITGAIFLGGSGAVIVGGLYWRRGSTAGAYTAMILGSVVSIVTIIFQWVWPQIDVLREISPEFPINGQIMGFFAACLGLSSYVIVSLMGKSPKIDMDKLLHRGKYAITEEELALESNRESGIKVNWFWKLIGVNSHEFSKVDKGLFIYSYVYLIWTMGAFAVLMVLHYTDKIGDKGWLAWWRLGLMIQLVTAVVGIVWTTIGGFFDLAKMYRLLSSEKINHLDDGRVIHDAQQNQLEESEI